MSQSFKSTTSAFLSGLTTLEPLSRKINPRGANADAELQDIVNLTRSSILSGVYTRSGRRDLPIETHSKLASPLFMALVGIL